MEGLDPQQQRVAAEVFGISSNAVPVDNVILEQISPTHQDLFDCLHSIRQSCIDVQFPCVDGQPNSCFDNMDLNLLFEINIESPGSRLAENFNETPVFFNVSMQTSPPSSSILSFNTSNNSDKFKIFEYIECIPDLVTFKFETGCIIDENVTCNILKLKIVNSDLLTQTSKTVAPPVSYRFSTKVRYRCTLCGEIIRDRNAFLICETDGHFIHTYHTVSRSTDCFLCSP